jgi:glucuronate isomerase
MPDFLSEDFLLRTETARVLYHEYCEKLPIIDFHCHLSPEEIAIDKRWDDISQLWLGGDHYKWRAMRTGGIEERFITGGAAPYDKFAKYAELMPRLIGNPLYHWSHLELRRYFGITKPLSAASCGEIWDECNHRLKTMSARSIISSSKVELIYTTDDPCDSLEHHKKLKGFGTAVLPAWRPDRALNPDKTGFSSYIERLGGGIRDFDGLKAELSRRMDYFHLMGCRNSDHGLDRIPRAFSGNPDTAFRKALDGQVLEREEAEGYRTALLLFLAEEYGRRGWVMQLHFGAVRNDNPRMFARLAADSSFDAICGSAESGPALAALLGKMEERGALPRTVLYSLNPADNAQIGSVIGCFQSEGLCGRVQQGAAWWFNDTKRGIEEQLVSLASLSVLPAFVGMATDSRSFLSYARHEYFRRILCNLLGAWAEDGEYPRDIEALGRIVADISYCNAAKYFGADGRMR